MKRVDFYDQGRTAVALVTIAGREQQLVCDLPGASLRFTSLGGSVGLQVAVGQNLRYLFWDDYPSKVVYFKGFLGVHRGTGVLTHCQVSFRLWKEASER